MLSATAIANPNIAFIKYWGNQDEVLRIPSSGSISMNLDGLRTSTQVTFEDGLDSDRLTINGSQVSGLALDRVRELLVKVRAISGMHLFARVESENNFPSGTGIASSASAFAALSLAAVSAAGMQLEESELSRLARTASGSACRSVPTGFVEWQAGFDHMTSFAFSIAPPSHWRLADCITIINREHKSIGSYEGHRLANRSPLQPARLSGAPHRLNICRQAILERDFDALADVVELDSNLMHAVIMTSNPRVQYWQPITLQVMLEVVNWRKAGIPVCFTIDAGPNVHVLCEHAYVDKISKQLQELPGVLDVLISFPGKGTRLAT